MPCLSIGEKPEGGRAMWEAFKAVVGLLVFAALLVGVVHWIDAERSTLRRMFSTPYWRHLL